MDTILLLLNLASAIGVFVLQVLLKNSIASYASEKGKNLATKEDVAEITRLVESTKLALQHQDRFEEKKYELKYAACLNMLKIVENDNDGKPVVVDKQFATADEIRTCHNELILAIDESEIVKVFVAIVADRSANPIKDLDRLRALTRRELGFVGQAHADSEAAWIGISTIKPEVVAPLPVAPPSALIA